jgi:type II secretory pathway predicted ATPase ExeA/cell division septation protein DedD
VTQFSQTSPGTTPVPVRHISRASLLTYEPYYGLREKAFSLSVDPRFLYKSRSHAPVFDDLLAGIRRREGLIVLTGDIGMGKTTLCRAVLENLDRKTFSTFVHDPFVSREDLLKMMLIDFGVMSTDDLRSGRLSTSSRADLSCLLYEFLRTLVPLEAFAVLVIDEAQNLPVPLLEEIRILSDLEAPEKLLQVVLVGQLELRAKLKLSEMRQLDQRVSVRCDLDPLSSDGVAAYIVHRLQIASGGGDRVEFSSEATDLISQVSSGVPRVINLVCDRALYRGYLARVWRIDREIVEHALGDLRMPLPSPDARVDSSRAAARSELDRVEINLDKVFEATLPVADETIRSEVTEDSPSVPPEARRTLLALTGDPFRPEQTNSRTRVNGWTLAIAGLALTLLVATVGLMAGLARPSTRPSAAATSPPPPASPSVSSVPATQTTTSAQPQPQASEAPAKPPARGTSPAATASSEGAYAVDVALFASETRAGELVDQLKARGFSAYQTDLDLGDRGHLHEVLVGVFKTRDEAEAAAERIRDIPSYKDARVTSTGR